MVKIRPMDNELIWISIDGKCSCCIQWKFDNLENIRISPLSRAYTFSDSVYEVIPFHNAKGIAFDRHIKRLQKSCNSLSISANIDLISKEIIELINKSKFKDGYVYYQVSRGVDQIRSHMFNTDISTETFGYVSVEISALNICERIWSTPLET